jgi:anti-sigma B factor antagonist
MHLTPEPRDDYTVLHLRGEFDTYYCPLLVKEIEGLIAAGSNRVVLNMRLVKFINSTALGAIIKASKALGAQGGGLTMSRPSPFVRDIIKKVGLDRIVHVYDSDEDAGDAMRGGPAEARESEQEVAFEEDEAAVLFTLADAARLQHFIGSVTDAPKNPLHGHSFGKNWRGVGRMSALDSKGLAFTWNGGRTGLNSFEMGQLLALGTELQLKFRLPLLQRGHVEAAAAVTRIEERPDGVKVSAEFKDLNEETQGLVAQYAKDMAFLKRELEDATDG